MNKRSLKPLVIAAASFIALSFSKADKFTKEEQALLDKNRIMQMYKPDEHSRHFTAHIDAVTDPKTGKTRKMAANNYNLCCVLFLGSKTQNLHENKGAVWRSFSTVHRKLTSSFLPKDGTSTATDFSPGVTCKKARTLTTQQ
jgi:hypothetical protein